MQKTIFLNTFGENLQQIIFNQLYSSQQFDTSNTIYFKLKFLLEKLMELAICLIQIIARSCFVRLRIKEKKNRIQ